MVLGNSACAEYFAEGMNSCRSEVPREFRDEPGLGKWVVLVSAKRDEVSQKDGKVKECSNGKDASLHARMQGKT